MWMQILQAIEFKYNDFTRYQFIWARPVKGNCIFVFFTASHTKCMTQGNMKRTINTIIH